MYYEVKYLTVRELIKCNICIVEGEIDKIQTYYSDHVSGELLDVFEAILNSIYHKGLQLDTPGDKHFHLLL